MQIMEMVNNSHCICSRRPKRALGEPGHPERGLFALGAHFPPALLLTWSWAGLEGDLASLRAQGHLEPHNPPF